MRITVKKTPTRADDLRVAADVRRDLWAHAAVEIDREHPLHGTHRDEHGRAYFEFSTVAPDQVRRVLQEHGHGDRVELSEVSVPLGEACQNCGNIAGPILPAVCPNCRFRDISPCPSCGHDVPRKRYVSLGGRLYRCPNCQAHVRLRFNDPMFLSDGNYNQPLVVVEAAILHEV